MFVLKLVRHVKNDESCISCDVLGALDTYCLNMQWVGVEVEVVTLLLKAERENVVNRWYTDGGGVRFARAMWCRITAKQSGTVEVWVNGSRSYVQIFPPPVA